MKILELLLQAIDDKFGVMIIAGVICCVAMITHQENSADLSRLVVAGLLGMATGRASRP